MSQSSPRHCPNSHCAVATAFIFIHNNHPANATILTTTLPQLSPCCCHSLHLPQQSPRQCHKPHHDIAITPTGAVANIVPLPFYYYSTTLAMLMLPILPWCCHHSRHADTTTPTMSLPQLSRLSCHSQTPSCCRQNPCPTIATTHYVVAAIAALRFFRSCSVLFQHGAVATLHTIVLPHLSPFFCHNFKQCFLCCCRNPHCCCHELTQHF
jgi:hypothetical protein